MAEQEAVLRPPDPPWEPHPFPVAPSPAQALLWGAQGRALAPSPAQAEPGREVAAVLGEAGAEARHVLSSGSLSAAL